MTAGKVIAIGVVVVICVGVGWALGRSQRTPDSQLPASSADHGLDSRAVAPTLEPERRQLGDDDPDALHGRIEELEQALEESRRETARLARLVPATDAGPQPAASPSASDEKAPPAGQALLERMRAFSRVELEELRNISLKGATLTPADLELLASLPNLKSLSLHGTNITDDDLAVLAQIPLDHLDLRATNVTGKGLAHIRSDLLSLHLTDTKVAPRDFDRLPHMDRLQTLKLNGISVDDTAIEWIGRMSSLRHLEIDRTLITHDGLTRLIELNPDIQRIEARQAAVDPKRVGDLLGRHPNLDLVLQTYPVVHLRRGR